MSLNITKAVRNTKKLANEIDTNAIFNLEGCGITAHRALGRRTLHEK